MNKFPLGMGLALLLLVSPLSLNTGVEDSLDGAKQVASNETLNRKGSLLPLYNFPAATRGDRFARHGLDWKAGIRGWRRYGRLIKHVAREHEIDPYVLGAYVWVESGFDPHQYFEHNDRIAVGLGSVQATDHPRYSIEALQSPYLNLSLTAGEFSEKWEPTDMAGTVMDVWYPAWRKRVARGERIPVVHQPEVYIQAIANRYYALREIDSHFRIR